MEGAAETTAVTREIFIDASPETVWSFLVDPERATRWMELAGVAGGGDPGPDPWISEKP